METRVDIIDKEEWVGFEQNFPFAAARKLAYMCSILFFPFQSSSLSAEVTSAIGKKIADQMLFPPFSSPHNNIFGLHVKVGSKNINTAIGGEGGEEVGGGGWDHANNMK